MVDGWDKEELQKMDMPFCEKRLVGPVAIEQAKLEEVSMTFWFSLRYRPRCAWVRVHLQNPIRSRDLLSSPMSQIFIILFFTTKVID